ncbi:hypothetical protein WH96_11500 [Kiloniella spongiae]|uniref:PEGA domain-containing protein n=1 Tax=Kiloniella spongiae TaxID=1489064 RepID=A0A0H2MDA9_9PROT|nr:hypothetical protein [Kiloniella spongiae]KLN60373.1 hypothetical protein WH96_11500 [Kiloniella spongiae]
MSKILLFVASIFLLSACSTAETTRTLDERPSIGFSNVPKDAEIIIDGLNMGLAGDFDGKTRSLTLVNGSHKVKLVHNGQEILSQNIYLNGPSVTILRP